MPGCRQVHAGLALDADLGWDECMSHTRDARRPLGAVRRRQQAVLRRDIAPGVHLLQHASTNAYLIEEGDAVFTDASDDLTPDQRGAFLGEALRGLSTSYVDSPPPATFRIIASPLVTWIWLGALIVFAGGLIAMWPAGARARKPADAAQLADAVVPLSRLHETVATWRASDDDGWSAVLAGGYTRDGWWDGLTIVDLATLEQREVPVAGRPQAIVSVSLD